jgi:propanol-preferring alcohol dehydrogenase
MKRTIVKVCGACHTELDEIEERTSPPPSAGDHGHEVLGQVVTVGDQALMAFKQRNIRGAKVRVL